MGIVGKANLKFASGEGLDVNIQGSTVGTILFNGEDQGSIPSDGELVTPGVAKLQQNIVNRTNRTISVIALRVTMLDTGAVINLGRAKVGFFKSGL